MASPDIETEPLPSRHPRLLAVALLVLVGGATALGIAGRLGGGGATSAPAAGVATSQSFPPVAPIVIDAAVVDCSTVRPAECREIAQAAASALPARVPPVRQVSVSASLLCDSALDCPPSLLSHSYGLGSAVVSFVDGGPEAWLNVIEVQTSGDRRTEAWVVRWVRPSASIPLLGQLRFEPRDPLRPLDR